MPFSKAYAREQLRKKKKEEKERLDRLIKKADKHLKKYRKK